MNLIPPRPNWALLALTLLGGALRLYRLNDVGLSHYDAGIYAQSGLWPWVGTFHFAQGYFSPPLFPLLLGAINALAGTPIDWAGPLISALAGTLLIPVIFWNGKYLFGPSAGLWGAALVSLDPGQLHFSRLGLTDELFTLLFFISILLLLRALNEGGFGRAVGAGLAVGLCWNTKYHGFLPLLLVAPAVLTGPTPWQRARQLLVASLVALATYLPWAIWFHVEQGYETLLAHQRGYFRGVDGWGTRAWEGLADWTVLGVPWAFLMPLVEAGFAWRSLSDPGFQRRMLGWLAGLAALGGLGILLSLTTGPSTLIYPSVVGWGLLGGMAAAGGWRAFRENRSLVPAWVLAVLLFLPTLYAPYARLWLPTETALILLAAGAWGGTKGGRDPLGSGSAWGPGVSLLGWSAVGGLAVVLGVVQARAGLGSNPLEPHAGYREVVRTSTADLPPGRLLRTLGRWPLNYYLAVAGKNVAPLSGEGMSLDRISAGEIFFYDQTSLDTAGFRESVDPRHTSSKEKSWILDLDLITRLDDAEGAVWSIEQLPTQGLSVELRRYEP
jgi:4-amino-4-deoxy-L-arabinose transferase-like glycosyltransferase